MAEALQAKASAAAETAAKDAPAAIRAYEAIVADADSFDAESVKVKEAAITSLGELYVSAGDGEALRRLLSTLRPLFNAVPKAKTAKVVRGILDMVARIPDSEALQVELCTEVQAWSKTEKRTFLRQRVEARLASLHLARGDYQPALALLTTLLTEVKRLDDKTQLVDIHLVESRAHHALRNLPKAKAALTAARTAANAVYVPPSLQAQLDLQTGVVGAEEKDFKTAYSYFYEAFEQFSALGSDGSDAQAVRCLMYMIMCKVMTGDTGEINGIISTKGGLKYAGVEVDAMKAVAAAHADRSLAAFEKALADFGPQLQADGVLKAHLSALMDTMLEQNLLRIIEPYSRVEIAHVASMIGLPLASVEAKLSQMILDKKLSGTLDQGTGVLVVFDDDDKGDKLYKNALDTIEALGSVVDHLHKKSLKLVA